MPPTEPVSTEPNRPAWRRVIWPVTFGAVLVVLFAAVGLFLQPLTLALNPSHTLLLRTFEAEDGTPVSAENTAQTAQELQNRLDLVHEGHLRVDLEEEDLIKVRMTAEVDPGELEDLLTSLAELSFHPIAEVAAGPDVDPDAEVFEEASLVLPHEGRSFQLGPARIQGGSVANAKPLQQNEYWSIEITFDTEGAQAWRELTGDVACHEPGDPRRGVGIVLGEDLLSAPEIAPTVMCEEGMEGGKALISGMEFDEETAAQIADRILLGQPLLPFEVVEAS